MAIISSVLALESRVLIPARTEMQAMHLVLLLTGVVIAATGRVLTAVGRRKPGNYLFRKPG